MADLLGSHINSLHEAGDDEIKRLKPTKIADGWVTRVSRQPNIDFIAEHVTAHAPIAKPSLFQSFSSTVDADLPTLSECAVHLELLEAFHALRSRVVNSLELNVTFGIEYGSRIIGNHRYPLTESGRLRNNDRDVKRREKWLLYLKFAVARFIEWSLITDNNIKLPATHGSSQASSGSELMDLEVLFLPPLDILLVWHAFLLNPADFGEHCQRRRLYSFARVRFPWQRIHEAIDPRTWEYSLPQDDCTWILEEAHLEPDLVEFLVMTGEPDGSLRSIYTQEHALDNLNLKDIEALNIKSLREKQFLIIHQKATNETSLTHSLAQNVLRQEIFVDKMHAHLWIRSPAVQGTLQRARSRYQRFLELFRIYPRKMLVPIIDIDLVWHTHQLSANRYTNSMWRRCGRFINHNDKLAQPTLQDGMSETRELYRVHFGQEYSTCLCWDCEAMASALQDCDEDELLKQDTLEDLAARVQKDVEHHRSIELIRREEDMMALKSYMSQHLKAVQESNAGAHAPERASTASERLLDRLRRGRD